jgi:hypothetical protein
LRKCSIPDQIPQRNSPIKDNPFYIDPVSSPPDLSQGEASRVKTGAQYRLQVVFGGRLFYERESDSNIPRIRIGKSGLATKAILWVKTKGQDHHDAAQKPKADQQTWASQKASSSPF